MKKILFLLIVTALLTACGSPAPVATAVPTTTQVPATETLVPPTETPMATATTKPLLPVSLNLGRTACGIQQIFYGQPVIVGGLNYFAEKKHTEEFIQVSIEKVWVDGKDPIVITDPSFWGPPTFQDLGGGWTIYFTTFEWKGLPALEVGKHHIEVEYDETKNFIPYLAHPYDRSCVDVTVIKPDTDQQPISQIILGYSKNCSKYELKEGQPAELITVGFAARGKVTEENYIKASLEKIWVDNSPNPIVLKGSDGWSPVSFVDFTKYYFANWAWTLPTLSKGDHTINLEFDVTKKIQIDKYSFVPSKSMWSLCTDITIK